MQVRAELLRTHAYAMAGLPSPPHPVPAAPVITFKGIGLLGWHGSPGAVAYSVQRRTNDTAPWETVCDRCATDADAPWIDEKAKDSPMWPSSSQQNIASSPGTQRANPAAHRWNADDADVTCRDGGLLLRSIEQATRFTVDAGSGS